MTQRIETLDLAKIFAMFFIVAIHTGPFKNFDVSGIDFNWLGESINIFSRFAVPFFFMLSGYLYFLKPNKTAAVFKSVIRMAKLFIIWICIYALNEIIISSFKNELSKETIMQALKPFTSVLMIYYGPYHLWFLVSLIYSIIILHASVRVQKVHFLMGISTFLYFIGLLGQSYDFLLNLPMQTRDTIFLGVFFTTLGYCLAKHTKELDKPLRPTRWLILFAVFSTLQIFEGIVLLNAFSSRLGNYYVATIPASITFMMLFLSLKLKTKNEWFKKISQKTLGIYLIHPLVMKMTGLVLYLFQGEALKNTVAWHLLYTPFVFIVSFLIYEALIRCIFIFKQKPLHRIRSIFTTQ